MNTILTIDMTHLPNSIKLGRCGENHTVIRFDCTSYLETYGNGSAALLFQPARGSMHPVVIEQDGAMVTWHVSCSDTSTSGAGLCELSWYVDDMLVKSQQMSTIVYGSLSEQADDDCKIASRPWMDQILQASANAQRAQAAADAAQHTADALDKRYTPETLKATILDIFYPVGTIYHATDSAFNPNNTWGGTWERIQDRFLLAAGTTYTGGSTGGEATHKLTTQELPSHTHTMYVNNDSSSSSWVPTTGTCLVKPDYVTTSTKNYSASLAQNGSGLDRAHNNMPPYLAVYIWKRIA